MLKSKRLNCTSICLLSLLLTLLIITTQTTTVQASTQYGHANVELIKINHSAHTLTLTTTIYATTNTSDIDGRSSCWLWFQQGAGISEGLSFLSNDTAWTLIGNNGGAWDWKLEKTIEVAYSTVGGTFVFPFDQYKITFYMNTNFPESMEYSSSVTNLECQVKYNYIDGTQAPFFFASPMYEGLSIYQQVDMTVNETVSTIFVGSLIYSLFVILIVLGVFVFQRRSDMELSNAITILSSILVFLPVLIFTFRTSIAPNSITPVDIIGLLVTIGYGGILIVYLRQRKWRAKLGDCDYDFDCG